MFCLKLLGSEKVEYFSGFYKYKTQKTPVIRLSTSMENSIIFQTHNSAEEAQAYIRETNGVVLVIFPFETNHDSGTSEKYDKNSLKELLLNKSIEYGGMQKFNREAQNLNEEIRTFIEVLRVI